MVAIQKIYHHHVLVLQKRAKSYLYYPLLRARPRLLSVLCISPTLSASSLQIHTIGPLRPGVQHSLKPDSTNHLRSQTSLSRSFRPCFSPSLWFSLQKMSRSSLVCCSTLAALFLFFHYLVRFSSSSSSSLCLPLHRSHHQLFLLLLLLLLPLAHIDSLLSVRHGLKNLTDVR